MPKSVFNAARAIKAATRLEKNMSIFLMYYEKLDSCKFHTRTLHSNFSHLEFLDRNLDKNSFKNFKIFQRSMIAQDLIKGNGNLQENSRSWQEFHDVLNWGFSDFKKNRKVCHRVVGFSISQKMQPKARLFGQTIKTEKVTKW